jgi:hypothetical protein
MHSICSDYVGCPVCMSCDRGMFCLAEYHIRLIHTTIIQLDANESLTSTSTSKELKQAGLVYGMCMWEAGGTQHPRVVLGDDALLAPGDARAYS